MTGRLAGLVVFLASAVIAAGITYAVYPGAPAPKAPIPLETSQQAHPGFSNGDPIPPPAETGFQTGDNDAPTFARSASLTPRTPRPLPDTVRGSVSGSPSATVGARGTPGPSPSADPAPEPSPIGS